MNDDNVFDQFVDWGDEKGEGMSTKAFVTKQPFSSGRVAPSFADPPDEHDRKIINSLPKREFIFIFTIIVTLAVFEIYHLYTNIGLW